MTEVQCKEKIKSFLKENKNRKDPFQETYEEIKKIGKEKNGKELIQALKVQCQREKNSMNLFSGMFTVGNMAITVINFGVNAANDKLVSMVSIICFLAIFVTMAFVFLKTIEPFSQNSFLMEVIKVYEEEEH